MKWWLINPCARLLSSARSLGLCLILAVGLTCLADRPVMAQCQDEGIRYVRPGGNDGNTGLCWANAFKTFNRALEDLHEAEDPPVTEIRLAGWDDTEEVGQVIYRLSDIGLDPITEEPLWEARGSFFLAKGCTIQGGYRGVTDGGGNADDRDFEAYQTILSGDLDGDDDGTVGSMADNSSHVIDIDIDIEGDVTLDGLTITGGNANNESSVSLRLGGGVRHQASIMVSDAQLEIRDCRIVGNRATRGGGVVSGTVVRCRRTLFEGNRAQVGPPTGFPTGGVAEAGAIALGPGTAYVVECVFVDNRVVGAGAGGAMMFTGSSATVWVTNSIFTGNMVDGSIAPAAGGAIVLGPRSLIRMTGCLVTGNQAPAGAGGGIACALPSLMDEGLWLVNSTVVDNAAAVGGGVSAPAAQVHNSIVYNNTGAGSSVFEDQVDGVSQEGWVILRSCIEGIDTEEFPGTTPVDPQFVDPTEGNFRLRRCSPLVDAGDDDLIPADVTDVDEFGGVEEPLPWDLDRRDRVSGPVVDLGAYEFESSACAGDLNGDGAVDGLDLAIVLGQWGACATPCEGDANCDGVVDGLDLAIVLGQWGECPGGESMMMSGGSGSESLSGSMTPASLATLLEFENVEAFVAWLITLDFGTMSPILGLLIDE